MTRTAISRLTTPEIQVKYQNLGDFGGTDPVDDLWTLEVSGPTYEYRGILARMGLRWKSTSKTWGISATLYRYNNARRNAEWVKARKIQETAYPQLVALAKAHNERAREENAKLGPADDREQVAIWRRLSRMVPQLQAVGIKVEHTTPGRYEVGESKVWVSGNTYNIRALMMKHGFRWDPTRKAWSMPGPEFAVVGDKWMSEVVRSLPEAPAEPEPRAVFSEMSDAELTKWVMANVDGEYLSQDGEVTLSAGVAKYKMYLRRMDPEYQEKVYKKLSPSRQAGEVVPFFPRPRNTGTHVITIGGEKYVLSTHWPGVFGDISEQSKETGGVNVIRQDDMNPWKYLWVYDTEKQILAMWRVMDGNEKEWGSARTAARTIVFLERKGQLNRVDNAQFRRIQVEMARRERENEAALEKWIEESKDNFQREVDGLVREYFNKVVRPVADRAVANVEAGVIPIGFKAIEGGFPVQRQMKSHVLSRIYNDLFNLDRIDEYVQSRGVDLNSGDIQATQWAQGDVWTEYARSVLR